jgi:YbgC/YbaW family acyl-CoA thioester hydrolase
MAHRTELTVRFNELDPYNHVNHAAYITYLEVARTEALEACGIPIVGIADSGFQLVITKIEVRYVAAAGAGDHLTVTTELATARRASSVWKQRVYRGEELLIDGDVTIAVTDLDGRPTRPPDWLFPAMEALAPGAPDLPAPTNNDGAVV